MFAAATTYPDPWRFQPNVEVYVLVAFLVGAYIYMVREIGPHAVEPGQPVITKRHLFCFIGAMALMFAASTWPIHQIGEDYLYSVHMFQHMILSYFLPPLILFATPEWLLRAIIGEGRTYRVAKFMCKPVIAGVIFNVVVMILHVPVVVNTSTRIGPLHFGLHTLVVLTALLMWMPIISPMKEFQIGYGGKMIYLFLQSVVPTVPAGWLVFADGVVYKHYAEQPVRVWGVDAINDQQAAGAIMKVMGGWYLWGIVIFMWFKRFAVVRSGENSYRRGAQMPTAEITGNEESPLTYGDVVDAFDRTAPTAEPAADRRP